MEYVYHGSKTHNLKELIPHKSTHGNYVYATKYKGIATIMSKKCGDDATYSLNRNDDGSLDLVERIPGAFEKMFCNSFSLYSLDGSFFKDIKTGFSEVVSDIKVPILNEEKYDNLMDAINKLVSEGIINIYRFPNRPFYIPEDDSDLIHKIRKVYIERLNYKFDERMLSRWIFLHPNLEKELRKIADEQNVKLSNYEEIKKMFIELQKQDPEQERFIENALEMYEYYGLETKNEMSV